MKSMTYEGVGFVIVWSNSNGGIWKTPRVGIAKKLGGGYIMEKFGGQNDACTERDFIGSSGVVEDVWLWPIYR